MASKLELMQEAYERGILPEDKKPLVEEALQRGLIKKGPEGFMPSLNKRLAETLGFPLDLLGNAWSSVSGKEPPEILRGSENLKAGFRAIGAGVQESEPQTMQQAMGAGVGDVVGMLPAAHGVMTNLASKGIKGVSKFADDVVRETAKRPVAVTAAEMSMGATAGGAGQIASNIDPALRPVGEIIGGTISPVTGVQKAAGAASRAASKTLVPFTKAGARPRAEARLQSLVGDLDSTVANLEGTTITEMTPARKSGDKRLLGMEAEVRAEDAAIDAKITKLENDAQAQLESELEYLQRGDPNVTREYLESRVRETQEVIESNVASAVTRAEDKIRQLGDGMSRTDASDVVRRELEQANELAMQQEKALFDAVPDSPVSTSNAQTAFEGIAKSTPQAQQKHIPDSAKQFLGEGPKAFGDVANIREMQGLRSELLQEARIAESQGNKIRAGIAKKLAKAIREDFEVAAQAGADPAAMKLREALVFSRERNRRFTEGTVGKLLKTERVGGGAVSPELTLQQSIGRGGDRAKVAYEDISEAAPGATTQDAMAQYIRDDFTSKAVQDGKLNIASAKTYLRSNRAALDKSPEAREAIEGAIAAAEEAKRKATRGTRVIRNLSSAHKSAASRFLNTPVTQEFDTVLKAKNPEKAARELMQLTRKSEEATLGVQTAAVESLLARSKGSANLGKILDDPKYAAAYRVVLPKETLDRLRQISTEMAKYEMRAGPTPKGGIIDDAPNKLLEIVARVGGVRASRGVGGSNDAGASLQTAQIVSSNIKRAIRRLTNDKARDLIVQSVMPGNDELMKALLTDTTTAAGQKQAIRRLNLWLIGAGEESITGEDGDEDVEGSAGSDTLDWQPSPNMLSGRVEGGDQAILEGSAVEKALDAIPVAEASGNKNIGAHYPNDPTKSASGAYGFIDSTWRSVVRKYGKEYGLDASTNKNDYEAQRRATRALIEKEYIPRLTRVLDREPTAGELYLAHFAGPGGAEKLLKANPNRDAALVLPAAAKSNAPVFFDKKNRPRSVNEVISLLNEKVS